MAADLRLLMAVLASSLLTGGCVLPGWSQHAPAADFSLTDTRNVTHTLRDYRGDALVIDFMATWCGPCRAQMGELRAFQNTTAEHHARILSIDADPTEPIATLVAYAATYGGGWPFARDAQGVALKYGLVTLPRLVIVDSVGRIAFEHDGLVSSDTLLREVAQTG